MERDILVERVKNGLANAKAKGIRIGRKKTRPSELIRRLRIKGLTFRECARLANCSQGAVAAEMRSWNAEKRLGIETIRLDIDIPPIETPAPKPLQPPPSTEQANKPMEIVSF